MQSGWFARLFFAVVGVLAVAGLVSGTACTRWGQPGPVTPTVGPLPAIWVDPVHGSDSTGNGNESKPYRTLTKALAVFESAKQVTSQFLINLEPGSYTAANGEIFPIVIPKSVALKGMNYGHGPQSGVFINGVGEDTIFEKLVHASPHTAFTTLEALPPALVGISDMYVGTTNLTLPGSNAFYASFDTLTSLSASDTTFGVGRVLTMHNVDGILVTGGTLDCTSCTIHGSNFGVGAFTAPLPTSTPMPTTSPSPYSSGPTITLSHGDTDSTIGAKVADIITDGSVNVNVSGEMFESGQVAFSDALAAIIPVPTRGAVDFGGGALQSTGLNNFIGARDTEIAIKRRGETVYALDDTWNPNQQGATRHGQYVRKKSFDAGAAGKNVTIVHDAVGSTVTVGPATVPTPSPTIGPTPTPTPT
ncbi:MAG TPA: DUF1565 domain-containing protein [Candidatus Cybelea sp.]|jgi:hypothetical protein|nr:DUF1565 domain-containing protein [Candidatus Cybelea sp.]